VLPHLQAREQPLPSRPSNSRRPELVSAHLEWTLPDGAVGWLDVRRVFETVWEDSA